MQSNAKLVEDTVFFPALHETTSVKFVCFCLKSVFERKKKHSQAEWKTYLTQLEMHVCLLVNLSV